jgi:hypothetical protein
MGSLFCCCSKSGNNQDKEYDELAYEEDLENFNRNGPDAPEVSSIKLALMNNQEKFEHHFPFYRMDVNGYVYLIKLALIEENPDMENTLENATSVKLSSLQKQFKNHDYWSDLNNEGSDLVKFLKEVCGAADGNLDQIKMRILGILWCCGEESEKIR